MNESEFCKLVDESLSKDPEYEIIGIILPDGTTKELEIRQRGRVFRP